MKLDSLDIFSDVLLSLPGRLISSSAAIGLGCLTPSLLIALLEYQLPTESLWLDIFFGPFTLLGIAFSSSESGYWAITSLPLAFVTMVKAIYFLINERGAKELFNIFGLSFFAAVWILFYSWHGSLVALVLCFAFGWGIYKFHQEMKAEET